MLLNFFSIIAFILISLIGNVSSLPINDQSTPLVNPPLQGNYDGLDILFLIDQSGSMGNVNNTQLRPNDPLGLRFYSPWYAMYWMGEDRLLVHNDAVYRMAVVNFGSQAYPYNFSGDKNVPQYWATIDSKNRSDWQILKQKLTDSLTAMQVEYSKKDLGFTDFRTSFVEAQKTFTLLPDMPGKRLKVIVLLTDGQPCTDANCIKRPSTQEMQKVQEFITKNFSEEEYRLYVVGMIDYSKGYWDLVKPSWEVATHDPCTDNSCSDPTQDRAGQVSSNDDVGKRFQEILQDLTSDFKKPEGITFVDTPVLPGPLAVPPYLESITFTFFKANVGERLDLIDPQGKVDANRPDVSVDGVGGPIEALRIANPQPGSWTVSTDPPGTDVDITMRQIFAKGRLDSPTGPQVQFIPLTVQYGLLDDKGQPLPSYPDPKYRLQVKATIAAGGETWDLALDDKGSNTYAAEFIPVKDGPHTINVHAESIDPDGKPVIVFDGEIGRFDVGKANLLIKDLPNPWPQYQKNAIKFILQDTRGLPLINAAQLDVTAEIEGEDGSPMKLAVQQDGTYQVDYKPTKAGLHTIHIIANVTDSSNHQYLVLDINKDQFNVSPATLVSLNVISPNIAAAKIVKGDDKNKAEVEEDEGIVYIQQNDTGLWPFSKEPLILEIQIQDENKNPLDVDSAFKNPKTALLWTVTDQDRKDYSQKLILAPTDQRGVYRAETKELGMGKYRIEVRSDDDQLKPDYVFDDQNSLVKVGVERIRHPWHLPILGALLLLIIGTVATIATAKNMDRSKRVHPCRGKVVIVDAYGAPRFTQVLDTFELNKITFTTKDINPITHITRLEITCSSDAESEARQVLVNAWLDSDKNPLTMSMRPASEMKLRPYNFWLLKDPTEEQLMLDRSQDVGQDSSFSEEDWSTSSAFQDPYNTSH